MRITPSILVLSLLVVFAGAAAAQTGGACDGLDGNAFGLCNAYCEAMDCDSPDHQASDRACDRVYMKFEDLTGDPPPCACPCLADDPLFASFVSGELPDGQVFASCTLDGSLDGDPLDFSVTVTTNLTSAGADASPASGGFPAEGSCGSSAGGVLDTTPGAAAACAELLIAAYEEVTMGACAVNP